MDTSIVPKQDAAYLRAHYKTQSVPEMAKELKRGNATVYGFMETLGLPPLRREIRRDHPFKVQNRKLETMLTGHRIANSNRQQAAKK